jgi:pimeloyl-ACP methyl ester carboxylesterase
MPTVTVNGTELYYEIRGMGPPVLLIMGATGDGGHFDALAELLAHEFTVVSYVRRGNVHALDTGPAAIFGTSSGGNFALCLMIRRPELVRGAILHEPGLYALVDDSTRFAPR